MGHVDDRLMYGFCRGCQKWKKRGDLKAANIRIYGDGVDVVEKIVRLRLCPECYEREFKRWTVSAHGHSLEWEGTLYSENEIRMNEELSGSCDEIDFDDSQSVMID